ncbi:unnamed protein product [Parnassius mnemosyne]|uniref:Uncharacterized protein n=1 Tax=Parnassius mnemosyne TaxID=213953 RepID=A0AAV1KQL0_9NEOP
MDAYLKTRGTQRPLTSKLVHELIGDGCNWELENSDGEDLLNRVAAAEQPNTEDEMDADIESTVRPYAEADVPVQNPEFSMPEGEPPSKLQRFTNRSSANVAQSMYSYHPQVAVRRRR